ncbi:histidine phosphatase family protein [Fodinicurvata sp. EGI_FJ10296]|uniref:SixA phosphatase family protein n=1 Tax=Fodinicurvata sp. EGI_FJ10296 TaxID=3231908 RepID=UPI003452647F
MKELFLLRHCKSSWDDPDIPDHDRPLTDRGRQAAGVMGRYLLGRDMLPELILCSTAVRTTETMRILTAEWPCTPPTEIEADLYLTGRHALLSRIARVNDNIRRVLAISHNPDVAQLALSLGRDGDSALVKSMEAKFPTGALAQIDLSIDRWADLPTAIGTLRQFVTPKSLGSA